MTTDPVLPPPDTETPAAKPFELIIEDAVNKVSLSSRRIYQRTYEAWYHWCLDHGRDPFNLHARQVLAFLKAQRVATSTRKRHLAALRQMAKYLTIEVDPQTRSRRESNYRSLRFIRAPEDGALKPDKRSNRTLEPEEANMVLRIWAGSDLIHQRNRALIAVLLLSGARRSEIAVLRWADIDFANGLMIIARGKGGKQRTAALIGNFALNALKAWKEAQGPNRQYVFCRIQKGNILGNDRPLSVDGVYDIVIRTAERLGENQHFSPHDSRRTLIIEALINGASIQDVKDQVGHRTTRMTEQYARSATAHQRRQRIKLRYGDDESSTSH